MLNRKIYIIFLITIIIVCALIGGNNIKQEGFESHSPRLCCIYAYYEKDKSVDPTCVENLEYFMKNAIQDNVDYYFVINGSKCSVKIPTNKPNIKRFNRENKGFDFGAYSYMLDKIKDKSYDYYFFVNTSVCGPFLGNRNTKDWTQVFIDKFNKPDVKIVGTVLHIFPVAECFGFDLKEIYKHEPPYPHLQSMVFCINRDYKDYLFSIDFFNEDEINNSSFHSVITHKEIALSQHALNKGWKINSVVKQFEDQDYSQIKTGFNPTSNHGEPYCEGCFFGSTITPEEALFFKTNKGLKILQ